MRSAVNPEEEEEEEEEEEKEEGEKSFFLKEAEVFIYSTRSF